jgi:hypothetical protein
MADITLGTSTDGNGFSGGLDSGIVWTSPSVGYFIFIEEGADLVYCKTTDGGLTWAAAIDIRNGATNRFSAWYDKWTNGDSGGLIHIASMGQTSALLQYQTLDTSDDTVSSALTIVQTASLTLSTDWRVCGLSLTKARGGNLYIAEVARNDAANLYREGFWRSTDAGASFTQLAEVFENTGDAANTDRAVLMPGNETDNQDILAIFYDDSNTELSLKTYDNSGDLWAEVSISTDIDVTTGGDVALGYATVSRHSDNATIVVGASTQNAATHDIHAFDIDTSASITTLTDVFTDNDNHHLDCALFIDQNTDDLYAVYIGSDAQDETPFTAVGIYYKKSEDGGATWGSEVDLDEDADAIHRCVWAGHSVGAYGGRFMPVWSEDLTSASPDEYKANRTNSIAITGTTEQIARISVKKAA